MNETTFLLVYSTILVLIVYTVWVQYQYLYRNSPIKCLRLPSPKRGTHCILGTAGLYEQNGLE